MTTLLAAVLLVVILFAIVGAGLALFAAKVARQVEAVLPPIGSFIDVDGARLHYVDRGAGPTLLLIHGLGGQVRNFTFSLVDQLVGEFRVIVVDRPGSGHSTRARGASAALRAQAATIAALIEALDVDRPLLVGHSLGGALSLTLALEHPERVAGVALIAPLTQVEVAPPDAFARLAIASPLARRLVAWTLATPLAIRRSRVVLASIFAPEAVPRDFATDGGGLLSLRPKAFHETSTDLVAINEDLPALVQRYGELELPVGILFGRGDNILAPAVHGERTAAEIPGATIELVEGGHMLPVTQPERCAAFVRGVADRVR